MGRNQEYHLALILLGIDIDIDIDIDFTFCHICQCLFYFFGGELNNRKCIEFILENTKNEY